GGRLLGPSSDAVRRSADKLALGRLWQERGLPTPPARLLLPGEKPPSITRPAVCKPRRGAGAQATFIVSDPAEWPAVLERPRAEGQTGEMTVQPFVPGTPASVAWLIGPSQGIPMSPAAQHLSENGQLHYRGGEIPLPAALARRAVELTRRALACVEG